MRSQAIRLIAFASMYAVAGHCYGADNRSCETRTRDQQLAYVSSISGKIKQNDSQADKVIPVIQEIALGHEENVSKALSQGFDPNTEVNAGLGSGVTILDLAISACQPSIAILLINNGARVDGDGGSAPLVNAAEFGMDRVVSALIEHSAKLDKTDFDGDTALREAVAQGHYSTVKLLLEAGADANNSGRPGESLVGIAGGDANARKITNLLSQYGAKGKTP